MEDMTAILVRLSCQNGNIRMHIQIGCSETVPEGILDGIQPSRGALSCHLQEEDIIIELIAEEGGGRKC